MSRAGAPGRRSGPTGLGGVAARRPLTVFLALALGVGWPVLVLPVVLAWPIEPSLLVLTYVVLLGSAILVSRWADGPSGVRRLLGRVLVWRFGAGRWAVIVLGMPVLTLLLAAVSGTLERPDTAWAAVAGWYLFDTLVFGALLLNLWEEAAWGGFAQSRLTARHGLLVGALLTAAPFAAIHVPLLFAGAWTWREVGVNLALLFGLAPCYRYLLGMHLLDTGGSILAIAVQHAAWNASINLDVVRGQWQAIVAVLLLTVLVAVGRRVGRPGTRAIGREAEMATASAWTAPGPTVTRSGPASGGR